MTRYARHLLLAEIGEAGQARLSQKTLRRIRGERNAAETARDYLVRAGVVVSESTLEPELVVMSEEAVRALAEDPDLVPAASFIAGSFAAVELIKETVGAGEPGSWPAALRLSGVERER